MRYKNIPSAIHNFGASFTSLVNYFADGYVIDDLDLIHRQQIDIEIDWLGNIFRPMENATERILISIRSYRSDLERHLLSENVELRSLVKPEFHWPAQGRKFMAAVDDRGKDYKIYVNESK
ncbi:hypothetical protein AAGS40_27155 (plasmid) [Paraburkholderia sp. PREW-6R]|uniref:hypothetical protein n=1 Tax=Paraburkholderia sp. PREW-6R TaxID=3141544 RepID=UPI0031F49026